MGRAETVWRPELFQDLDGRDDGSLYLRMADRLEAAIRAGELEPGAVLPDEVSFAAQMGRSRWTVQRAIQHLVAKGLLVRWTGLSTRVVRSHHPLGAGNTASYEEVSGLRRDAATHVVCFDATPVPSDVAARLGVTAGSAVTHARWVRSDGDGPIGLFESYLSAAFASTTVEDLTRSGLYAALRSHGARIRVVSVSVSTRIGTVEEHQLLGTAVGDPVLTAQHVTYDDSGRPVEAGNQVYRTDRFEFEWTLIAH